jgi:hypothetical protein
VGSRAVHSGPEASRRSRSPSPSRHGSRSSWALVGLVAVGAAARLWWAAANGSSFDESFTGMAARRPLGDLLRFLRDHDSHPPLDYLIRAPLARLAPDPFLIRLPSLAFSIGALMLFAWWAQRRINQAAVPATFVMALSPFQIMYGGEARMYALLELLGVVAFVLADRWLSAPRSWHATAAGAVTLLAVFDHVSGLLLAAGLFAVAGVRRDTPAWRWRAAIVAPVALWSAAWGPSFLHQQSGYHSSWIPKTSLRTIAQVLGKQVTSTRGLDVVVVAAVVAGSIFVVRYDRVLGRVLLACAALPFVLAALVGTVALFFIDRTLTIAAWAPPIALGFLVAALWARRRLVWRAVIVVGAIVLVCGTGVFLGRTWEYDASIGHLESVVRPGDVVAVEPAWYGPLVEWRLGASRTGQVEYVTVHGLAGADAIRLPGARGNRRVWVLWFSYERRSFAGFGRCADDWSDGVTTVSCLSPR